MPPTAEFYRAQADQNAEAAASADLVNVRERCLRAAASWRAMAERAERIMAEKQAAEEARAQACLGQ